MPTALARKENKVAQILKKIKEITEYSRPQQLRANSILWTYTCLAPPYKI